MKRISLIFLTTLSVSVIAHAQDAFKAMSSLFTTPDNYVVTYAGKAPVIDGDINDPVWQQAKWTTKFVDIEGDVKPAPPFDTQVKMLWDDSCLYVAAKLQEPNLWAKATRPEELMFLENDFEIFIDPNNNAREYFEIEVNQLNKVFDLFLTKAYRDHGQPLASWDAHGMQTAVKLQGTISKPGDKDTGWTVEFKIPFSAVMPGIGAKAPRDGAVWRANFLRVEWDSEVKDGKYVKLTDANGKPLPEHNWSWSPQGLVSMHYPERFGYLMFSKGGTDTAKFEVPYTDLQRQYLWLIYYSQKKFYQQHKAYAASLGELGITTTNPVINNTTNTITLEGTRRQFIATISDGSSKAITLDNEGWLRSE